MTLNETKRRETHRAWQLDFYKDLPSTPTGRARAPVDRQRPDMTPAQEAARLRVSSKLIARKNRRRPH